MNRKLISKALSNIDDSFIAETMTCPESKTHRAPERTSKMGKYENRNGRNPSRKLFALILAACLVFSLAITAFAANLFGIREMFRTYNRELPEAAEPYIQTQTEAAQGEDWSCRVSESLCDLGKVLTTVVVSGGDQYIVAPDDAYPSDGVSTIGLPGDQTLEEYARDQGKQLLFASVTLMGNEELGVFTEMQKFENSSPSEMTILLESTRMNDGTTPAGEVVCSVFARGEDGEQKRLEVPFTLSEAPASAGGTYVPEDPDAIPGMTVGEATVTQTPLGISVRIPETVTDQDAFDEIMKVEIDGITYLEGGGVLEDDGNIYFQFSMGQGTVTDTLIVHYYDWDKQPIGDIVFKKKYVHKDGIRIRAQTLILISY